MPNSDENELESQLQKRRQDIFTESYPISLGELTNLYRDGELNVHPDFQRFFRWDALQKSRLVESILLGIPLPSIFVSQDEGGRWELVDGVQRVSTILELQGLLRGPDGTLREPLTLQGTDFLPALANKQWESEAEEHSLTQAQRLDIKRAKIDVKIVKRTSAEYAKYELFKRLNSYGATLTAQELRSCLIVSVNSEFQSWVERLARDENFVKVTSLSERLLEERYDVELVLRFLILHNLEDPTQRRLRILNEFLDDQAVALAKSSDTRTRDELERTFKKTFAVIEANGGGDVFRKWNETRGVFQGSFLNTSFEIIGMGVGYHIARDSAYRIDLLQLAMEIWSSDVLQARYASGRNAEARIARLVPWGRQLTSAKEAQFAGAE